MKQKWKIVIILGCLLTLVNMGIAGFSVADNPIPEEGELKGYETPVVLVHHADANGPYSGSVGVPISFSGDGTYISGSCSYQWDFGDDSYGFGKYPTHRYLVAGEYVVTLTVTDSTGALYKDVAPVFIEKPGDHLVPYGGCHYHADAYEEIIFDATDSISTGTDIVEYSWDFGDGTTAIGETVTHTYTEERVYMVTLEITDSNSVKRYDVLHADIGMSYSDDDDFYANLFVDPELGDLLEYLLDTLDFTTGFFCGLFDAQIYTNYNGQEKFTDLSGLRPLPVNVDVNGDGDNDIKINNLKFFKTKKSRSLFDEDSRVWYQFETTLSDIQTISGDILAEDDFTVCLQLNFGIISQYLGLDDTLMRIGYHSEPGEEMPDTMTVTHILRPYLLFRILGWDYWPEYGLKIDQASGGDFSLFGMILNTGGSSKTTLECNFENVGSSYMYKRSKDNGILNHDVILEIPGASNSIIFTAIREKSGETTEISTRFAFSGSLTRGIGWSDEGLYIGFIGETAVSLYDFYFENPNYLFTLGEITFSTSGSVGLNFDPSSGGKFTLDGLGAGFRIGDLFFNSKGTDFEGEIVGTLDLTLGTSVLVGFAPKEIDLGFEGEIRLSSDTIFRVNDFEVTIGGDFALQSDGDIAFTWGDDEFNVDLEGGVALVIEDFNFEVGNLIANASLMEIATDGGFGISWDTNENLVTISGSDGVALSLEDLDFQYVEGSVSIIVSVIGDLEIQAGGWLTFGPDTFSAGFEGSLNLGIDGAFVEFDINENNVKVGGDYEFDTGDGQIGFSWADDMFSLDVEGNPTLSVEDLFFEIELASGDTIIVIAEEAGIGANGEFGVTWDSANDQVTVTAGGGVELLVKNLDISVGTTINIKTFGTLEIQAGGSLTFGPEIFEAEFEGSLDLGTAGSYVSFEVNGEGIDVGGKFTLLGGSGEISLTWTDGEFCITVNGGPELEIEDLYFDIEINNMELYIGSDFIEVGAYGDISIDWNAATEEMTVTSDLGVMFGVENFNFNFDSGSLSVEIIGSLEIQADGYVNFAPGEFEAGFTGTLNLGGGGMLDFGEGTGSPTPGSGFPGNNGGMGAGDNTLENNYAQFIINGESLKIGGLFSLSSGEDGEISFSWDENEFSLYVTGNPSLTAEDLYFEADLQTLNRETETLKITVDEAGIGANGDLSFDWDTSSNEITVISDMGVELSIDNLNFSYDTLSAKIIGYLEVQADGYVTFAPGEFEAGFSGSLNLGTGGDYCEFEINENSIKVGGNFGLSTGDGQISFEWTDTEMSLFVSGSPDLAVTDLYFEFGDLLITSDYVELAANGELNVDLDTANNEVTISSGSTGISLSIENIEINYGTTLEVEVIGALELEANGYLTFGDGVFEAGFEGSIDFGVSTQFNINGDGITVGGQFDIGMDEGEISLSWINDEFLLDFTGGAGLTVTNLYFLAEIDSDEVEISVGELGIGFNGDFNIEWDTVNNEVTFTSEAGVELVLTDLEFSYGSALEVSIIGDLGIQADGYITLGTEGVFEAGFTGSLNLGKNGDYVEFTVNSDSVKIGGDFGLSSTGDISISWEDDELSFAASGNVVAVIKDLYFEIATLKITTYDISFKELNGQVSIEADETNKRFELDTNFDIEIQDLQVYIDDSGWNQVCSLTNFDLLGGGYILADAGTDDVIELNFDGSLDILNLAITPPSNWNFDLTVGSINIDSFAESSILIKKDPATGDGTLSLESIAGGILGQINNFDANVLVGSTDLQVDFYKLVISGEFGIYLDDASDEININADGTIDLDNFNGEFGNFEISADVEMDGNGDISTEWTEDTLYVDADVDYIWEVTISSPIIGEWTANGELIGAVIVDANWPNNQVDLTIDDYGSFTLLEIIHDSLSFKLGDIYLEPGSIIFSWYRDDANQNGWILVDSEFTQNICSLNLAELSWGTKSLSVGWPCLKPGDFKFTWNVPNKKMTVNNGIEGLGPTVTYKDTSQNREIFASAGNLQDDYSKTMTLEWYEDGGQISGLKLDTDNVYLANIVSVGSIKGASDGKKISLDGLKCNDFYIRKLSGEFEFGGQLQLASGITFSKLENNDWKDLSVEWDLTSDEKIIRFTRDPDFDLEINLFSVDILGFTFSSQIDLMYGEYIEIKWDIGTTGAVSIDTDWEYIASISFTVGPDYGIGLDFTIYTLRAQDWRLEWTAWPPQQWNIEEYGTKQYGGVEIDIYYDGSWHDLWPW